jgi:rare lipoprotein A
VALLTVALAGCAHHRQTSNLPPTAPPQELDQLEQPADQSQQAESEQARRRARIPMTAAPAGGVSAEDIEYVNTHRPIRSEVGYATWYTAPYKGRRAANGQVFNDHALTAAHRTLPMGSLVVVTNLKSGQSSAMRITDRGPFVDGRILDLTVASAKATGVYRAGLARVRVDVYETPKPIDRGGRWCVQIGAFHNEREARKLKSQLQRKYPDASVIEFPAEETYWVRIRPQGDDRNQAESIAQRLRPEEGEAFLTRLD